MGNTMAMTTSAHTGISPDAYGPLILEPMQKASVALQVSTVFMTNSTETHFPRVNTDITAAWTAEGAPIGVSDLATDAYVATPKKLASITKITNELLADSNPAAATLVGQSIARVLATEYDKAFFGNLIAPAPAGLGSLTGTLVVNGGTAFTNADPFVDGVMEMEANGAILTGWVASPATARVIAKLKQASGSNVPLVTPDVAAPSGRLLQGVPLFASAAVPDNVV